MDITKYFRVVSATNKAIYFEMKDFWSDQVVDQIGDEVLSQFKNAIDKLSTGGKFIGLVDMTEFAVLAPKTTELISQMMIYGVEKGAYKVVEVLPKAVTSLGLKEAARKSEKDDFRVVVKSLAEAKAMVEELKQEL